jgi:hypothetical protein
MQMRLPFLVLALGCLLAVAGRTAADDLPKPDLKPFLEEVRKLVKKHYPEAKVTPNDQTIQFQFNTRKYMIHDLSFDGVKWLDAREEPGPQPGGIYCDIRLLQGEYKGQVVPPWVEDKRYFTLYWAEPYSKKLDRRLSIVLQYPKRVPEDFLKDFKRLTNEFETYIPGTAK